MNSSFIYRHRHTLIGIFVLSVVSAVLLSPFQSPIKAANGLAQRTQSHDPDLPNYDIRLDKTAFDRIAAFRTRLGKSAVQITDVRDSLVHGEQALRKRVPTLKVEYNADLKIPEVLTPDVKQGRAFLMAASRPSGARHSDVLRGFLKENTELVGTDTTQVDNLKVAADYTNPDGNLSFAELHQEINGVPVFRGEIKAGFTRTGEMVRVVNNLAPALNYNDLSTDFGEPVTAVNTAARMINNDGTKLNLARNNAESTDVKTVFGTDDSATTAEKIYFPTEPGVAVPAWRILIWQPVNAYYVIVDAQTGTMLWRKNITDDQTQPATYSVYTNPNAMINVAHNPFPVSPGPASPNGAQGASIGRTSITKIGNEPPYTFNNLGWITDGVNITDGNAVQAGLDRDGVDGVDTNSEAVGTNRNFTFAYNPLDPNTNTGDAPVPVPQTYPGSIAQQGAITQLFYACNWFHDQAYLLGFTEQAGNFQNDNFGRGGVGGDRVRGEGQDSSGTNNANFSTPADGGRGRMQIFIFSGPTPNIDSMVDSDVVIHEHTHGLSNRLHGNAAGLVNDMSRGMGEGWSDFFGLSMLSQASDPINGIYTTGAYDTYRFSGIGTNNNYYGIRRFPYAVKAFTGPNGRPHNPLTFADIDSTKINLSDGAFAARFTGTADEVHNAGEVWCSMLWEIRARMITRLGWEVGNRRALQIVTDGMKLAPLSPTFISERDAIVAAAVAGGSAPDVADVWAGFALRGLGFSASIQNVGGTSQGGTGTVRVTEAFDLPNLYQSPNLTISDSAGNHNGYPEPGETISLTIPLTNSTGTAATGVTLQLDGVGTINYGTLPGISTVSQQVSYTVPANASCGSLITLTLNVNSSLGQTSFTRSFAVGVPATTFTENFDAATAPTVPAAWTVTSTYAPMTFVSSSSSSDSAPNSMFAADLPVSGATTDGGGTDLTSPSIPIVSEAATVSFRHKYNTETGWDGGVLEISIIPGAGFQDIVTAGGTFLQNGYNGAMGVSPPNPLGGRSGWTGDSGGYVTTIVQLPTSAKFRNVQLRWRFGADNNGAPDGGGWNIDSIKVAGSYICFTSNPPPRSRADFDGDGKTDMSVFRPSDGNWYLQRSTAGFTAVNWGVSTDILTPGDFDGDGKTDLAVFRPSNGVWFIVNSSSGQVTVQQFGQAGDIPQVGDFDGDGKDDIAVWRPSNGIWFIINSSNGQVTTRQFGQNLDRPVAADYDGDGKRDIAVWRPDSGIWFRVNSSNGQVVTTQFGVPTDMPVPADYDGDNKDDIAVFRPAEGNWYRLTNPATGQYTVNHFGQSGDLPVPGDYDGDGKDDEAVYRAGGVWFVNASTSGYSAVQFGLTTDTPVPAKYIPSPVP